MPAEAVEVLAPALSATQKTNGRAWAKIAARLALALASLREIDRACTLTEDILQVSVVAHSATIRSDLRQLARILNRWNSDPAVRELAAHDDAQEDWVRIEITKALAHNKKVIPVLLSRTARLTTSELPPDMIGLAMQQHVKLEHREPEADLDRLVAVLEQALGLNDGKAQQRTGDAEFTVHRELGDDGRVEVDVVKRNTGGSIVGRLTGRVHAADLPRMAAFLADPPEAP